MPFNFIPKVSAAIGGNQMNPDLDTVDPTSINNINPLHQNGNTAGWNTAGVTIGDAISRVLTFLFPIVGMLLFIMILVSGVQIAAAGMSGNKSLADRGKDRLKGAVIGFIITVSAFLIMMLIQMLLGIKILGF